MSRSTYTYLNQFFTRINDQFYINVNGRGFGEAGSVIRTVTPRVPLFNIAMMAGHYFSVTSVMAIHFFIFKFRIGFREAILGNTEIRGIFKMLAKNQNRYYFL